MLHHITTCSVNNSAVLRPHRPKCTGCWHHSTLQHLFFLPSPCSDAQHHWYTSTDLSHLVLEGSDSTAPSHPMGDEMRWGWEKSGVSLVGWGHIPVCHHRAENTVWCVITRLRTQSGVSSLGWEHRPVCHHWAENTGPCVITGLRTQAHVPSLGWKHRPVCHRWDTDGGRTHSQYLKPWSWRVASHIYRRTHAFFLFFFFTPSKTTMVISGQIPYIMKNISEVWDALGSHITQMKS